MADPRLPASPDAPAASLTGTFSPRQLAMLDAVAIQAQYAGIGDLLDPDFLDLVQRGLIELVLSPYGTSGRLTGNGGIARDVMKAEAEAAKAAGS